jgi:hypothetical protein
VKPLSAEISARTSGKFLLRLRVPNSERPVVTELDQITCYDFQVTPELLRIVGGDIAAGASKARPIPGEMLDPKKKRVP